MGEHHIRGLANPDVNKKNECTEWFIMTLSLFS